MVLYAVENLLAGDDVVLSSSSEDTLYVLENLFNGRPSKPFRFTGIGAVGSPEWICAEFDNPVAVTLAAIFNHNLTALASSGDELTLLADDGDCSAAPWSGADSLDLKARLITGWNDLYQRTALTRKSWYLQVIDQDNLDGHVEIGEFFLGVYTALTQAHLQPGRRESPKLWRFANVTPYGQHWTQALSESTTLDLVIKGLNNPEQVDALRTMVSAIHNNNGKFVIIPDHLNPFAYYVHLENDGDFQDQVLRTPSCEVTSWTLQLRTLTKGVSLI